MKGKYFDIDQNLANQLLEKVKKMTYSTRGIDRCAYLFDNYAVLSTNRLMLRNVTTRDDNLSYFDELIETLLDLYLHGISVVPILGYCYDPDSINGTGYIFQKRAKGHELFNDAVLARFQVWAQPQPEDTHLQSNLSKAEGIEYLLSRTSEISRISQEHFDKFVGDMICILEKDILIDSFGKSNFFYDAEEGFQFIDLDSHNDYKYGLTTQKPDIERVVSICGFVPCHYSVDTKIFSSCALDDHALSTLTSCQQNSLAEANQEIFLKCVAALRKNGISELTIDKSLKQLKMYGCKI